MKKTNIEEINKINLLISDDQDRDIIRKCILYAENERRPAPRTLYEKILICLFDFISILEKEKKYFNTPGIDKTNESVLK